MLDFTWPAFAFAVINFLILTAILWKFLHKPLLRTLDRRQESIVKERRLAESESQKATSAKAEYEAKLKNAAAECDLLLAEARRAAEESSKKMLADAAEQAKLTIASLEQADQRERREAQEALQQSVADSALNVAATVLAKLSDDDIEGKLTARLLLDLDKLATAEGSVSITQETVVRVTSAVELAAERRSDILQRIKHLGSKESLVEFTVDASLVAGTRIEFSDRVVDSSLADVLARIEETFKLVAAPESSGEADS